jgi:hypothetical protein
MSCRRQANKPRSQGGKVDPVHPGGSAFSPLIYMTKDDLKEALPYYEKAIAIYRHTLSPIQPDWIRMR